MAANARCLLSRKLAALACKTQFLYMAGASARLLLRELHNVLATRNERGGRVRLTHQLRRDLK
jgi:hypothetical protein